MPKRMTIEQLARIVNAGFGDLETRMATKQEMRVGFRAVTDSLDFFRQEIREIKELNRIVLGPLARSVAEARESQQMLARRVARLERKVGIGR